MKAEYKIGDYISTDKKGKLCIKNDKKRLIKLAKSEIKKWIAFLGKVEAKNDCATCEENK